MTDIPLKLKLYPSSSGFVTDKGIEVEYNSACPRYMVASIGADRIPIDPKYAKLGEIHENWYEGQLGQNLEAREKEIRIDLSEKVQYSGRQDFVTKDGTIHETKATQSKSVLYQNVRKKKVKVSHLAQLVSYMIHEKTVNGRIVLGYYKDGLKGPVLQEYVEFIVHIDDTGSVIVNGLPSGYTVAHQLAHLNLAKTGLETGSLAPRPYNFADWTGPCKRCPLNNLCWAQGKNSMTDKEFKDSAKELINKAAKATSF